MAIIFNMSGDWAAAFPCISSALSIELRHISYSYSSNVFGISLHFCLGLVSLLNLVSLLDITNIYT